MEFVKMHGLGNDFILVEERSLPAVALDKLALLVCHRRRGIGADGLVLLGKSAGAPWRMQIFNSDGTEAEMCGNALRCVGKYLYDNRLVTEETMVIETHGNALCRLRLNIVGEEVTEVAVNMGAPILEGAEIPVAIDSDQIVNASIHAAGKDFLFTGVSMGNPHCVIFTDNLDSVPLEQWGPALENHFLFPQKTNVEFVQVLAPNRARMLVWERGVGITQACGSGACAALVAGVLIKRLDRKAQIELPGGSLTIYWDEHNSVYMTGPAETVFRGSLSTNLWQRECE